MAASIWRIHMAKAITVEEGGGEEDGNEGLSFKHTDSSNSENESGIVLLTRVPATL